MINGLTSVVIVFILMTVGFWFTHKEKWPSNSSQVFSTVVVKIAAPSLAITSISSKFTPDLLKSSVFNLLLILLSVAIMHVIGKFLAHVFKLNQGKAAVFVTTFTFNNTMFIGLPINQIVFGHDGLPYLFTFYLVTIVLFWSLGVYTLSSAATDINNKFSIQKIFSPGLIGVIIGCLLAGFQIQIPSVLDTALTYLSNICVPLSLLVIGSNLALSVKNGISRITIDQIAILIGKFILHPIIIFVIFHFAGVSGLPLSVFILTASLPCHAQTAILAQYYGLEGEYASNLVSLSTFISLFTIPIYAAFLLG